jgi:broad-specificity NMP kinase
MSATLVIGSSGIGKTTLLPLLKEMLPRNFIVYDFDEKLTKEVTRDNNLLDEWRVSTTKYWADISVKNEETGKSTVIMGLMYPSEIEETFHAIAHSIIMLTCMDKELENRLLGKRFSTPEKIEGLRTATGKTPEEFLNENKDTVQRLQEETLTFYGKILDTTQNTPQQTAERLTALIKGF